MNRRDWPALFTVLLLGACAVQPGPPPPSPPSPPDPVVGRGACEADGTWDFDDPADPANHRKFLLHADTLSYVTVPTGQAQLPVVPPGFGGVPGPPIPNAVSGTIEPRRDINHSPRGVYEAGQDCSGRVIARVTIDGTQSPNPTVRASAREARAARDSAGGQMLPDRLALLGGYKTELHQHGDYDNPQNVEHAHRYFPEGTSYVWMDRLVSGANGVWVARGVIVSDDTAVSPWTVRIRYCPHGQNAPTDPLCAPAHPVPPSRPLARWLDIPEDDHAWEWCSLHGCCIVESSTFR